MLSFFVEALCGGLCFHRLHSTAVEEAHIEPQELAASVLLLPEDVVRNHVLSFLKFREVVRLDSALANHTIRTYFQSALRGTVVEGIVDVRHLDWCRKRKCSAKKLRITSLLTNSGCLVDEMHFETLTIHATAKVFEHALHWLFMDGKDFRKLNICTFYTINFLHFIPTYVHIPLLKIHASGNMYVKEDVLVALVMHCPNLKIIHAIECGRCTEHLALALAQHCPQLREAFLTIVANLDEPHDEPRTGYCELFRGCRQLQVVDCMGDFTITNMHTLADNCRGLTSVTLQGSYSLSWWEETHTTRVDLALSSLVRNNTKIHTLKLDSFQQLSDVSLLAIAQSLPDLHTLCLTNSQSTLAGVDAIRTSCSKLTCLQVIHQRWNAPFDDLDYSFLQLCILTTLSMHSTMLTDAQLVTIAHANPNIHTLRIRPLLFAEGNILSPTALCEVLSYWPELEKFEVRKHTPSQHVHVEDCVLYALAQHCTNLTSIDIAGHDNVSSAALSTLSNLPLLRKLTVNRCINMTDSVIATIATQCPLLEVIGLENCPHISNVGINTLAYYCRKLTSVHLPQCGNISDSAIQYLIRRSRYLQVIDITNNPLLTFAAVAELPLYCLCMRHLRLYSSRDKPTVVEYFAAYRSNRHYFDIIFGWSDELKDAHV